MKLVTWHVELSCFFKFCNTEARVRSQGSLCRICGGPSSTKKIYVQRFFPVRTDILWATIDDRQCRECC
jgi:hypothetical protein